MITSMFHGDPSYERLAEHARQNSLRTLVEDTGVVNAVLLKQFRSDGSEDLQLITILVDMFHDFFHMSAARRQ